MFRALFGLLLALLPIGTEAAESWMTPASRQSWTTAPAKDIWIANRTDGAKGSGTEHDPYDGRTAAEMSAILRGYYLYCVPNITVHFAPGTYLSSGKTDDWGVSTHWTLLGSGQGRTIIKVDPNSLNFTGASRRPDARFGLFESGWGHATVEDLTIDASASDFGSALTAPFIMPAARDPSGVVVAVAHAERFERAIGRFVMVERPPKAAGEKAIDYGMMEVEGVPDSRHVRLMNPAVLQPGSVTGSLTAGSPVVRDVSSVANLDQAQRISSPGNIPDTVIHSIDSTSQITLAANALTSGQVTLNYSPAYIQTEKYRTNLCPQGNMPAGTEVPADAYILLNFQVCGLLAGRAGDRIERVTVENVQQTFYEGPVGIAFDSYGSKGPGAIKNCTVKNIWGTCGWCISLTNPTDVEIAGNKVYGNGWDDAYSMGNCVRVNVHDNYSTNTATGFFSDVGPSIDCRLENNNFTARRGMQTSGGVVFDHCVVAKNKITVTAKDGVGLYLLAATTNSVIKGNVVSAWPEALPGAVGLQCRSGDQMGMMLGDTTEGSPVLTNLSHAGDLRRHALIHGPGIPAGAEIVDMPGANPTSATMDQPATETGSTVTLVYGPLDEKNLIADNHVQFGLLNFKCTPKFGVQSGNTVGTDNNGGMKALDLGIPWAKPGETGPPSLMIPPPKLPPVLPPAP